MFRLTRYFSIASLVGIIAVVIALSFAYRGIAVETLKDNETRTNVSLTRTFSNSIWPQYKDFVNAMSGANAASIQTSHQFKALDQKVRNLMNGLQVVKVKIYSLSGNTVYSTQLAETGNDKSESAGFQAALSGEIVSEITFRDEFYSLEGTVADRNIVSTYIPIRSPHGGEVEGVFELYSDVTPLLAKISETQIRIISIVLGVLLVLYLFLFLIARRAERIMTRNDADRRRNEAQVRYHAYHDNLTGLKNRISFLERFDEVIVRQERNQRLCALMYIDIDRFKVVNDSLGHHTGDHLIKIVAKRLEGAARETDSLYRLGGDEFVLILEEVARPEDVAIAAERVMEKMKDPVSFDQFKFYVSVSMGIAVFPKDGSSVEKLMQNADSAMYMAKKQGGNTFKYYTDDLNIKAANRLELEAGLQRALRNEEFLLHYQPKIAVETGEIVGLEALLRWHHPEYGLIPPNEFIYILEETGLINQVGEWALETACRQLKHWNEHGYPDLRISVNISTVQFRSGTLIDVVKRTLQSTGIDPSKLDLELTESLLVDNVGNAIELMRSLKALGVTLSIDDFGSGYSSLNYLKQFPIDFLKIDRAFIKDLESNPKDAAITNAIAALAHNLKLGIVAEGVEREGQLDFIRHNGCQEAQGFYFSKALEADALEAWLVAQASKGDTVRLITP